MAKKKIENDLPLAEDPLNESNSKSEELSNESDSIIRKKFTGLSEYKAKNNIKEMEYKPQEWIDMSPAFKETTRLPGIPMGHVVMNYGKSDTGKTTMLIEAGAYAQKQGIVPVLVLTENKFSWDRAKVMGLDKDNCIVFEGIQTIEDGVHELAEILKKQEKGELNFDLLMLWDSIGMTPTKAEWEAQQEEDGSAAMMIAAKVIRAQFTRFLGPKINNTRKKECPYTNTLLVVNHAYTAPPKPPSRIGTLEPYGGDGLYLVSTLVFRQGGVAGRSSKVKAVKDKVDVSFAIKSALVVDKNHITNVLAGGNIICTDHGFILEENIDAYKKQYRDGWDLEFDRYWKEVSDN
jgi:hypothetical protein